MIRALVKKSDVATKEQVKSALDKGIKKYVESKGRKIDERDKRDIYNYTIATASNGMKAFATGNKYNDIVIIDRSSLIVIK